MNPTQNHVCPHRRTVQLRPRRLGRVLIIILGLLLAQLVPSSSLLPISLSGPAVAHAATDTVSTCDEPNFRAAINLAAPGDTINFTCSGTITLTAAGGPTPIQVSQALTIDGAGQSVTLSGGGAVQLFNVTGAGNLTIDNLTLTGGSTSGSGGAITSNGTLTINNSTVTNNTAAGNAGAIASSGGLTVTNSTFSGNTAGAHSGAIDANDAPGAPATIIKGDTFTGNAAAFGGAMAFGTNNPVTITNSTLTGNSATSDGGALYTFAPLTLSFSTVASNTGGSAIGFNTIGPTGLTVAGSILDNASNCGAPLPITDKGSNLTFQGGSCNLTGSTDLSADPQLGALAGNGGLTQTLAPSSSSPTIGAASCTDVSGNAVRVDQRGVSRPVSACTIGAFEADQANDTWVNALALNQTSGSYQVNQTVSQHIYTSTQERWYKFLVTPGSTLHIQYSGLPGAILSLHSDLQTEYNSLTNPQSAALESAKDAASGFLPQQFLPQQFLPQQFLPQQFLPQQFLPQQFLPQQFLPGQYSGAIYASLMAISATPNSSVQTIDHDTWNTFGYMYVRVVGPASASTAFSLTVTETGGICNGVAPISATPPSSVPTGLKTLILWDPSRITGSASDISTLGTNLGQFASRSEVQGTVIDLSQVPGIDGNGSAEQQADNNPACPTAKNIVASDIKSVIQAYRAQNPGLQYIVLVGDDHSIPYFRYPDESGLGPENQYYPPVADSSASNASLRDNFVLGQDEYGASVSLPLSDVSLPLPELAVGRLVRTAAEASHMLDVYTSANGIITPASSLVTGYDFVADAAANAQAELQAGTNATPDALISPQGQSPSTSWTASDLRQKLFGSRHDIVFMAGHFSAGGLEAADYATALSAAEVASSTVDMSNSLILALGCHGGYNIPGGDAVPNVSPAPDWPEAMAEKGATLLAATGYAYGDTVLTEYGEHLFDNYVRQLRSYSGAGYVPVAAGQAEVAAKKEYLATHTNLTGVDEKTLLETTLYGLPMLQVNMTGQHISTQPDSSIVSSAPAVTSGPGQQLSLGTADVDVQPTLTSHTVSLTNSATNSSVTTTYLTGPNNGEVARPGEPIFPSQSFNVHVSSQILRGVGFRGGSYSDLAHITPLTSAVGTETSVGHPAFYSNVFYPSQVWTANYFDAINGGSERLVTTPAQYISTSPGSTDGTLRQFNDLKFRLFYLPSNWVTTPSSQTAVAAPPQIASVLATRDASGNVTFNVHVSSDQTAGTQGVWITYTDPNNPGTWQSIDLNPGGTDSTLWTATQSLPSSIVFMVQAVNGTGLVTLSTNSGAFYTVGAPPTVTTPTTISVQSGPASGVYQTTSGTFQVHLQYAGNNGPAPLGGQLVTLQLGSQQAIGTTDSSGNASMTLPLNQPPGSYTVVATFAGGTAQGTTYQGASSAPATFNITPAPTTLSLAPASGASADYSDPAAVTATLTDNTGSGLVQRTILFTITGNGLTYNKTAITDYLGRATLGSVALPAGTYSVAASFGGADHPIQIAAGGSTVTESDPNYLTSTAAPTTLTMTQEESTATYNGDTVIPVSSTVHLSATVSEPDDGYPNDLSQAQVKFVVTDINGNVVASQVVPVTPTGALTGSAAIAVPGPGAANVYTISTMVVGNYFTSPTNTALLAVYNPSGGFVTGGGWITSQPAWCQLSSCSPKGGKATFAFNSRYQSGTTIPTGQTEFSLAGLVLESTSYQWMTISSNRVQLQGTGTINGAGSYSFMVTAIDGDMGQPQNGTDFLRIKIWNPGTGAVIYDTQPGAPNTNNPTTPAGGGNIVIHSS